MVVRLLLLFLTLSLLCSNFFFLFFSLNNAAQALLHRRLHLCVLTAGSPLLFMETSSFSFICEGCGKRSSNSEVVSPIYCVTFLVCYASEMTKPSEFVPFV